ncbi:MAG: hypothetical protein ACHP65_01735 [Legionellales bacterium]
MKEKNVLGDLVLTKGFSESMHATAEAAMLSEVAAARKTPEIDTPETLTKTATDVTAYPLIPLKKNAGGDYPFPRTRYGILPYHISRMGHIIWGCIESNRVGPITLAPAAGTQDVIAIKEERRLVLESGKPLPDLNIPGLIKGQLFRDQAYQDSIECLIKNGFQVYLENPLTTAIHEAHEEHGIDLCHAVGHDRHLLTTSLELSPNILIPEHKGVAPLCVWFPELINYESILLRHTDKVDRKMRRNFGQKFYEQGCWVTLDAFKSKFNHEKEQFVSLDGCTSVKIELITEALSAFELNMQLIEKIHCSLVARLPISEHPHAFFTPTPAATRAAAIYESIDTLHW